MEMRLNTNVYKYVERDEDGNIIKSYSKAKVPVRKHMNDSGADAFVCFSDQESVDYKVINPGTVEKIPLGIACEIPDGFEIQIRPRSGSSSKGQIAVFGTVDSDYRGQLMVNVANISTDTYVVRQGDRLCQLVLSPIYLSDFTPMWDNESDLGKEICTESDRGSNGFGSTGK
jgi:dUTP pyrophosphatase